MSDIKIMAVRPIVDHPDYYKDQVYIIGIDEDGSQYVAGEIAWIPRSRIRNREREHLREIADTDRYFSKQYHHTPDKYKQLDLPKIPGYKLELQLVKDEPT